MHKLQLPVRREILMEKDMKFILALFLCGVVYATASPTCSEKELDQCGYFAEGTDAFKETEAYLNEVCRSQGCLVDYNRRCGTTGLKPFVKAMLKQSERIYNAICGKESQPMRQKYLDNARCLIRVTKEFATSCPTPPGLDVHDPNFCPSVEEYLSCTYGLISSECGSDAREMYEASTPDLEFYGC